MCCITVLVIFFFFQAEDGIRDLVRSRGLGDVYKRQKEHRVVESFVGRWCKQFQGPKIQLQTKVESLFVWLLSCLLYTSDAADERSSVDLGGRRIIKKKKLVYITSSTVEHR